ncbi:MAG: amidohydrolase family protein [Acidimicrobiales bacterium]|jgi:predicted TIM-barrel fold metal-dependent hydrolase|nr:amidohydrolase family protein [Acidimicrobiales bacterium]
MDAERIRAELDHPVVDADGHTIEYLPLLRDLVADEGGGSVADRFDALVGSAAVRRSLDVDTRRAHAVARTGWWALPSRNTLDRATAMLPGLLYERLDTLGIDVAVLYPTVGLTVMAIDDDELRRAVARACNRFYAQAYGPYGDRLRPVGVIPTYDPDEAVAELEYATGALGLRGFLFGGLVLRPTPGREPSDRSARWADGLGLDSAHDYDPLWRRCSELAVSPTFHSTGIGFGSRTSPTNYVANHIGNFAAGGEAVCRSLFFGGAMHRFPELRWAFLEGGVAWACNLLADTVGHFEKRNRDALAHYDPAALDREELAALVRRYGDASFTERVDRLGETLTFLSDPDEDDATLDEWATSGVTSVADIVATFTERCFFGCEADDPMNALAFDERVNPGGSRLRAMFASDIGHWDVPDFRGVLPEAWELVEGGLVDREQFADFMFGNVVRLFTATNPDFFAGTAVEAEAKAMAAG